MKTEIIKITPTVARAWLLCNTRNRQIRRAWVDTLKAAFRRGEYVMTHQGIAFSDAGELIDGQHRLTAIAELPDGMGFPMLVTTGLTRDEAYRVIDNGYKRAAADMLGRSRREVEVARLIVTMFSNVSPTPTLLLPVCERIEPSHTALVGFCNSSTRVWSSAPVRTAAVLTMMNHGDDDYVQLVYRALVTNDLNGMPNSARALVSAQLRGQIKASHTADLFCRCMKVFDPTKASVTRVQINDPSATIARLRPFVSAEIFGNGSNKRKAATHAIARNRNTPGGDHTPNNTHVH